MLFTGTINEIVVIVLTIVIVLCSVGIVISIQFQKKQKKKYKECLKLIKEKETGVLNMLNGSNLNNTTNIGENININELMIKLYDTYLAFIDKVNKNDNNFGDVLYGIIKEFYQNKIDIHKTKNYYEIVENIELLNYSILEYSKEKLTFRINITCFNYKKRNEEIISGSNLERIEQIILITYTNDKNRWLISDIEKVFEKNLGN